MSTLSNIRKHSTFKQSVYKSVIESPFVIKWPRLRSDLSRRILDSLLKVIEPVGEYKNQKRSATDMADCDLPKIVSELRILVGFNDVSKHLEQVIQSQKLAKDVPADGLGNIDALSPAIFICRRDIKPIHLCSHLLTLAALANIKLIPLPADSEGIIAQALNVKRVSVLFLEICETDIEESLRLAINEAPKIEAPWLVGTATCEKRPYTNTRIKVLKTMGTFTKKN